MPESFDVFISYKREDQAFAEMLRERLIAWGRTVWMDKHNIPAGAYWPDEIDQGLNASKVVIGVLSPRAVASRNVKNEWDWAIVNGKRLLMLMIESCKVPMNYVSINYIDFVKDRAEGLARLQAALTDPASPSLPADPYRDYLQALYNRINAYLAQTIIKVRPDDPRTPEPISLHSERTRGAVDALFEKRDEIDPLFMIGGVKQEMVELDGDFRKALDYFDGRVLLLGEPGAGKTITLLHFGRDAVVQRIQDPAKPLPVLAIIPTWDAEKQTPLAEWLADSYGAPSDVARLVAEGRALLLLDGLDELGGEREDPSTHKRYDPRRRFMGIIPANNQIIVTCRVKDYEEIGERVALKGAVQLQQLTDAQIRDYLSAEVPALWAALETDEELREMTRTPLLLSFFAFAYQEASVEDQAKLRDLRGSPGDLRDAIFRRYVKQRYEHEARKLKLRQPPETLSFTLEEIYEALGRAVNENVKENANYPFVMENVLHSRDFGLDDKRRADCIELAGRLHLLVRGDRDTFRFIHLLLRDYFGFRYALPRLRSAEAEVRANAALALGWLKDARAVEPLIAALRDAERRVRSSTADALGQIGDVRAVEPLIVALNDADTRVRQAAAGALAGLGDARAVEPLISVLGDANKWVRWEASRALGQLGDRRAVESLIVALDDEDAEVVQEVANALGNLGDKRAVEPLVAKLFDTDDQVNWPVAWALSELGNTQLLRTFIVCLGDANVEVRRAAVVGLGQLGDARAVEALITALNDVDDMVRLLAVDVLSEDITTPEALAAVEAWRSEQK